MARSNRKQKLSYTYPIVPVSSVTRRDKVRFNRNNIIDFPDSRVTVLHGQLVYDPSIEEMLLAYEMAYDYLEEKLHDPEPEQPKTEPKAEQPKKRGVGITMDGVYYKSISDAMRSAGYFEGTAYTDRDAANNAKIARNIKKGPYSWDGHVWAQA